MFIKWLLCVCVLKMDISPTLDVVRALVMLPMLLRPVLNKNTATPDELAHVRKYKEFIEAVPSSALLQIVPVCCT